MHINKQRFILVSDLWGKEKSEWISYYTEILAQHFEVVFYDSCDLANVDKTEYTEEKIHQQFVNGGVEIAVSNLLKKEIETFSVLGFSVGGFIAWRALLGGLKTQNLFAISATRLRYETNKPDANIALFYGEDDLFKPNTDWFKQLGIKENLYQNEVHELYKKKHIAEAICQLIIARLL